VGADRPHPVTKGTGKRFKANMIGAISNTGTLRFRVFDERFTGPLFLDFLKRLVKDNYLPYLRHTDRSAVRSWLHDEGRAPSRIKRWFLLRPGEARARAPRSQTIETRPRVCHER
jgi:hypothetical protein